MYLLSVRRWSRSHLEMRSRGRPARTESVLLLLLLLPGRNGNAVGVLVKRVITPEAFGFEAETASKCHQSKTVVLMGWTFGLESRETGGGRGERSRLSLGDGMLRMVML